MRRSPATAVVGALVLILCSAAGPRHEHPAGAHIRAALGAKVARNLGVSRGHISAWLDRQDGTWLKIQAYEFLDDDTDATLFLAVRDPRAGGRWKLGPTGVGARGSYVIHDITPDHVVPYFTDREHSGTFVLQRFDEKERIVEGTFEFVGAAGPETLRVSQGSFKLRYISVGRDGRYQD